MRAGTSTWTHQVSYLFARCHKKFLDSPSSRWWVNLVTCENRQHSLPERLYETVSVPAAERLRFIKFSASRRHRVMSSLGLRRYRQSSFDVPLGLQPKNVFRQRWQLASAQSSRRKSARHFYMNLKDCRISKKPFLSPGREWLRNYFAPCCCDEFSLEASNCSNSKQIN
jgi:hypothetical protein